MRLFTKVVGPKISQCSTCVLFNIPVVFGLPLRSQINESPNDQKSLATEAHHCDFYKNDHKPSSSLVSRRHHSVFEPTDWFSSESPRRKHFPKLSPSDVTFHSDNAADLDFLKLIFLITFLILGNFEF